MSALYQGIAILFCCALSVFANPIEPPSIGIVVMHGKGGMTSKPVLEFTNPLEAKGFIVANQEMPWSKQREYDVGIETAQKELESLLGTLRLRGAQKLFLAGHSQGGLVALALGSNLNVDGIIAIAPGGNVGSMIYKEKLGDAVEKAKQMIAEGKGDEKAEFYDFESSKGKYALHTTARNYLSWFDPDGMMNQEKASARIKSTIPVLFVAPTADYPGLIKVKQKMFDVLPRHTHTKLYEPSATHLEAPRASIEAVIAWIGEVVGGLK